MSQYFKIKYLDKGKLNIINDRIRDFFLLYFIAPFIYEMIILEYS